MIAILRPFAPGLRTACIVLALMLAPWIANPGQAQNPPQSTTVPDPTKLTTEQLLREIATLEKIFNAKYDTLAKTIDGIAGSLNHHSLEDDRQITEQNKLQSEINKGRDLRIEQQFNSINLQFKERDVRTELLAAALKSALEQAAVSTKIAVDAALQAQEKAFATQSANFTNSLTEVKGTFGKLLDAQQLQLATVKDDTTRAINALKDDSTKAIAGVKESVTTIDGKASGINTAWLALVGFGGIAIGGVALFVGGRGRQYGREEIVAHNPGTTTIRPGRA